MRRFLAAIGGVVSVLSADASHGAAPLGEAEGVRRVCTLSAQHGSARAERRRGTAEIAAAGLWQNPTLVAEHERTLEGPTEHETILGASIPLSVSGRRSLLKDAAVARSDRANSRANLTLFEAALAFREEYVAATLEARRLEVLTEHQARLEALGAVIQRLSEAGETAGYDLSRQRIQARLHQTTVERTRARAHASTAILEAWMGSELTLSAASLDALAGGALVSSRAKSSAARALAPTHPQVRVLEAERRASALDARAERRRWLPDMEVFGGYRTVTVGTETSRGISLGLSIPLPVFDHGQGAAALADADVDVARASASVLQREQRARAKAAAAELEVLEASIAPAEQTIAEAALGRDRAIKLYAAGEVNLAELLDAYRGAEEAQLQRIDLAQHIASVRLALMRSTGTFFEPALDSVCQTRAQATR